MEMSLLQQARCDYKPPLPAILSNLREVSFSREPLPINEQIKDAFPKTSGQPLLRAKRGGERKAGPQKIGVVFSGGQASGGHNVISGLFDALPPNSHLFGFLGGPGGIVSGKFIEISAAMLASYRNQGGFDLIGSGRTKIETEEQLKASLEAVKSLSLDGLVIIGGDDSNTNAAVLAEYFLTHGCATKVVGVPKTIDGDLQNAYVAISFGFDTACKVYSEIIGNIGRDALSAKKYTHFIKLMGRSASHIALECALKTHPNFALIGEEVAAEKKTLAHLVKEIADLICKRSEKGKDYGILLIPEGLIEFIPEMNLLIKELNQLPSLQIGEASQKLTPAACSCFQSLPESIQKQLLLERDPHGNIQLSLIETERLIIEKVSHELAIRKKEGSFKGKFSAQNHFLGYEGRAALPSNFDSNYCYALGRVSALLIAEGATGYMAYIEHLTKPVSEWECGGAPLTAFMHLEMRKGSLKPVIKKTLVDLKGKPFASFAKRREAWALEDSYGFPGPIQFFGTAVLTDSFPLLLYTKNKI